MIKSLVISLFLTLIIEMITSTWVGIKQSYDMTVVILANIITNPVVVFVTNCTRHFINSNVIYYIVIGIMEILAVIVEYLVFKRYLKYCKKSPMLISLFNNIISFSIGLLLFGI